MGSLMGKEIGGGNVTSSKQLEGSVIELRYLSNPRDVFLTTTVALCLFFGLASGCSVLAHEGVPRKVLEQPLTIAASCEGDFIEQRSWFLSIASSGSGELTVLEYNGEAYAKAVEISKEEIRALRKVIEDANYFELKETEFGKLASGGPICSLAITEGRKTTVVQLKYMLGLHELRERNDQKGIRDYPEALRAMRVFGKVRSLLNDSRAYDPRADWDRLNEE